MGWFKTRAQEAHRRALADAAQLVGLYRLGQTRTFVFGGIPIEFWSHLRLRFESLLWHVENIGDADLGDSQPMRELGEDLAFAHLICSRKYDQETQRNFRTLAFDGAVERLSNRIANPREGEDTAVYALRPLFLAGEIEEVETTLAWFSELPAPQSKKYSAAQAVTLVTLGKQALAAIKGDPSPTATAPRVRCTKCERDNDIDAAYCSKCGEPLNSRRCSGCGLGDQAADAVFCKRCGAPLVPPSQS